MAKSSNKIYKSGIYKIVNLINGKVYIGSTNRFKSRFYDHQLHLKNNTHTNSYLQNSWNKYGSENFIFEIVEIVSDLNLLQEREQFWLDEIESYKRSKGYNILEKAFSSQGFKHSEEFRIKNGLLKKGNRYSSKLAKEDVFTIRLLLRDTDLTNIEISRMFMVKDSTILYISKNRTWQEVTIQPHDVLSEEFLSKSIEIKNNRKPLRKTNKLTEEQVKVIKLLLRDANLKQYDICKLFNVDVTTISNINRSKTWTDVTIDSNDILDSFYMNIANSTVEGR